MSQKALSNLGLLALLLGPVVQNPINDNPRLKVNQGVYFSTPRCFFNADIRQNFTSEEVDFEKQE